MNSIEPQEEYIFAEIGLRSSIIPISANKRYLYRSPRRKGVVRVTN